MIMLHTNGFIKSVLAFSMLFSIGVQDLCNSTPTCCTNCNLNGPGKVVTRNTASLHANTVKIKWQERFQANAVYQPLQVENGKSYQHELPGEWDAVTGHVGFFHHFEGYGDMFINIIGLPTNQISETQYETLPWDRKAFWVVVDDGAPLHVGADIDGEYIDLETNESVYIYYAQFILYQKQGKDYSLTEYGGEWTYLQLVTDLDNNVLEHFLYVLDINDEIVEELTIQPGDKIQSYTTILDRNDPEIALGVSLDEEFRTVTKEPEFIYEHFTPNKDFVNEQTAGVIDFSQIDLNLVLWGQLEEWNNQTFAYSTVKDLQTLWDDEPASKITDWFLSLF